MGRASQVKSRGAPSSSKKSDANDNASVAAARPRAKGRKDVSEVSIAQGILARKTIGSIANKGHIKVALRRMADQVKVGMHFPNSRFESPSFRIKESGLLLLAGVVDEVANNLVKQSSSIAANEKKRTLMPRHVRCATKGARFNYAKKFFITLQR
ncbi:MAG: hypothetical protein JSS82_12550 [Bacteroidetes bacterium]|nr:hypothetical protein [Bacteroidota bacterium]